jgi:hypothetical protein
MNTTEAAIPRSCQGGCGALEGAPKIVIKKRRRKNEKGRMVTVQVKELGSIIRLQKTSFADYGVYWVCADCLKGIASENYRLRSNRLTLAD